VTASKNYKRSWKNLLLNKRYQLRFTLFMVGFSALLMTGLGVWVMRKANEATAVARTAVQGEACPKVPELSGADANNDDDTAVPMKLDDGADIGSNANSAKGLEVPTPPTPAPAPTPAPVPSSVDPKDVAKHNAMSDVSEVGKQWCRELKCDPPARVEPLVIKGAHCDDYVKKKLAEPAAVAALRAANVPVVKCEGGETFTVADAPEPEHHVQVQIDESSMTLTATVPPDYADRVVTHWACELRQTAAIDSLERNRERILGVLIVTGIALMLGLAFYGIKMTHRVAGPLFKVSLYLAKMRDGRFDKVYNLRKGDQLVDFYEHFKTAHAGVVKLEREDIDHVRAIVAAAEAAGLGDHEAVGELKKVIERKEKSLE
jgi:hypothetical protein